MKSKNLALITGASFGIGEALSRELVKRGWSVIGIARSQDKLAAIQKELGDAFMPVVCDISQKSEIERASKEILKKEMCPTHFFLNAGIAGEKVIENPQAFDLSMHEKIMAVNYFGVLSFVEFWEKHALNNGGANFIVTSSINAIFAPPTGSAYCASKAAISKALGLKGNLPFTWKPEKMARYMADFAIKEKSHGEPSLFYGVVCRFLRALPYHWTMKILKKL